MKSGPTILKVTATFFITHHFNPWMLVTAFARLATSPCIICINSAAPVVANTSLCHIKLKPTKPWISSPVGLIIPSLLAALHCVNCSHVIQNNPPNRQGMQWIETWITMLGLLPQISVKALPKQKAALWWASRAKASAPPSMFMLIWLQLFSANAKAPPRWMSWCLMWECRSQPSLPRLGLFGQRSSLFSLANAIFTPSSHHCKHTYLKCAVHAIMDRGGFKQWLFL